MTYNTSYLVQKKPFIEIYRMHRWVVLRTCRKTFGPSTMACQCKPLNIKYRCTRATALSRNVQNCGATQRVQLTRNACVVLIRRCVVFFPNVQVSNAESQTGWDPKPPWRPLTAPPPDASNNLLGTLTWTRRIVLPEDALKRSARCPAHPCHSRVAPALLSTTVHRKATVFCHPRGRHRSTCYTSWYLYHTGWVGSRVLCFWPGKHSPMPNM